MSLAADATILGNIGDDVVKSTVAIALENLFGSSGVFNVGDQSRYHLARERDVRTFARESSLLNPSSFYDSRRGRRSTRKCPIVTMTLVAIVYLLCLALWIIDLVLLVAETRITLVKDPEDDLSVKYERALEFVAPRLAATILGDSVIIWRVHAFWASSNWRVTVMIASVVLLWMSFASSIMLTYCVVHVGGKIVLGSFHDSPFCRNIQTVSYAAPAPTTAVATLLNQGLGLPDDFESSWS
ncbi:hypothetical protein WG66_009788 [Moniliophthora roreri]|nr:hypothetical protein WG66_009788 [Moniliophthora roreri]